jgi:hypothetical protein
MIAGVATAIAIGRPARWTATRLVVGLVWVGTAFAAHRLLGQKETHASALRIIEGRADGRIEVGNAGGSRTWPVPVRLLCGLMSSKPDAPENVGSSLPAWPV